MTEGRIALPSTELMPLDGECGTPAVAASGRRHVIRLHGEAVADLTSTSMTQDFRATALLHFVRRNIRSRYRCSGASAEPMDARSALPHRQYSSRPTIRSSLFDVQPRASARGSCGCPGAVKVRSSGGELSATPSVRELPVQPETAARRAVDRRSE